MLRYTIGNRPRSLVAHCAQSLSRAAQCLEANPAATPAELYAAIGVHHNSSVPAFVGYAVRRGWLVQVELAGPPAPTAA